MSENIEEDAMKMSKTMTASLIKGCFRGNSEKCCNWCNERIIVGSQMRKTFHVLKLLMGCMLEAKFNELHEARDLRRETKKRMHMHVALARQFTFPFNVDYENFSLHATKNHQC